MPGAIGIDHSVGVVHPVLGRREVNLRTHLLAVVGRQCRGAYSIIELARCEVFNGILRHAQHVGLEGTVVRIGTLVGRSVGILVGELQAAVAHAEDGSLEVGVALTSLPDVELRNPVNLRIPDGKWIDAISLRENFVALGVLIAETRYLGRKVVEDAVVVFCPSGTLHGDILRATSLADVATAIERMLREVLDEAAGRVQLYGHVPLSLVPRTVADGDTVVTVAHHVAVHASQVRYEGDGMLPEHQVAACPIPSLYVRRGLPDAGRLCPGIVLVAGIEVADVEENLVGCQVFLLLYVTGIEERTLGIFLMKPKPSRSLIVVALLHYLVGTGILAQESHAFGIRLLFVCAEERGVAVVIHAV